MRLAGKKKCQNAGKREKKPDFVEAKLLGELVTHRLKHFYLFSNYLYFKGAARLRVRAFATLVDSQREIAQEEVGVRLFRANQQRPVQESITKQRKICKFDVET